MIDLIRRGIAQGFMGAQAVIIFHIASDGLPQLTWRGKFIDINQLCFHASEPPLNHNVICPPGLPVHALADVQVLQKLFVLAAGKLAALIGVEDRWCAKSVHSVLYRLQDGLYPQRIGEIPTYDFPAVPVDDGRKIHMAAVKFDVSDVDRPHLV